jgi:uncharacterized protein with PIN domain
MKFAADCMLGRLAKWLRLLGYDTVYLRSAPNEVRPAVAGEGRILLTRDSTLVGKVDPDHFVFVEHDDPTIQLQQLIRFLRLELDPEMFFSRCVLCNGIVEHVEKMRIYGKVPDYVWSIHDRFSQCSQCGKIYWPGSHLERFRLQLEGLVNKNLEERKKLDV